MPLIPELSVFDLEESKAFYLGVLGFCVEYERPKERFAFLSRGEVQLMIEQVHDEGWNVGELVYPLGRGVNFSLEVDDIGVLYRRVLDHGVIPFRSLRTSEYQTDDGVVSQQEFLIQDPSGYLLRYTREFYLASRNIMNYAEIKNFDIANGEGVRTTLFVSGCRRGCKNCFNEVAWNFATGKPFTREVEDKIIEGLRPVYIDGLTLLGGEPMEPENQAGLVDFLERVRKEFPRDAPASKTIWCFTGDTLETELLEGGRHHTDVTDRLLECIDVLVDGPFVQDLYDITLRFRGSSNQRLIDMNRTRECLAAGFAPAEAVCLWDDGPVYATHRM